MPGEPFPWPCVVFCVILVHVLVIYVWSTVWCVGVVTYLQVLGTPKPWASWWIIINSIGCLVRLELVLVRQGKNKWLRCWSVRAICCCWPNQGVVATNFFAELSLTNSQSTLNIITLIMKFISVKLLFGCAVKHLQEMYFFVAEELLESLRFISSLHNLWVLENVRQLEGIFIQGSNYFHLVYFLLVLAIDLF